MDSCTRAVQSKFYRGFYNWGHLVARKPCTIILISVVVCLAFSARLFSVFRNPLPSETEQSRLWVPQDAQAIDDMNRFEASFSKFYRRNVVVFTSSTPGGNVLTSAALTDMLHFDTTVKNELFAWKGEDDDLDLGNVSYSDVCAQTASTSHPNATSCISFGHPLELWQKLDGSFDFAYSDANLAAQVDSGKGIDTTLFPPSSNRTVDVGSIFGGIQRDSNGHIMSAASVRFTYLLKEADNGEAIRNAAEAWEDQMNHLVGPEWTYSGLSKGSVSDGPVRWTSTNIAAYPQTAGAIPRELSNNISGDLVAVQASYFIILLYAMLIFGRLQPSRSRVLLAIAGVVGVGMSVAVAYGFSTLFVPVNPVVNVLPFILIGIGVDDMFVLIFALEKQPIDQPVTERMATAMAHAGVSITITSITDLFAFLLGTMSRLPALSGFCTFAAIGILFDFIFQITFFAGWMAFDAYRERKQKVDLCPCLCSPTPATTGCSICPWTYNACNPSITTYGMRPFIVKYYVPLLRKTSVKVIIIIAFAALTGFSSYGASKLQQNFRYRWFVNDDAKLQEAFDMQDTYYATTGSPVYITTPASSEVEYHTIAGQQKLIQMATSVQADQWVEPNTLSSWYPQFVDWLAACDDVLTGDDGNPCARRSCSRTYSEGSRLLFPHCSNAKAQRDADGILLTETLSYNGAPVTLPLAGSSDVKSLVDESGAAVPSGSYVPPASFYSWLDQFITDSTIGSSFNSDIVWQSTAPVRSAAQVAEGLTAARMRVTGVQLVVADKQVSAMRSMRDTVNEVNYGSSYPYTFGYLFYEQYAIITNEAILNLALALCAVIAITLIIIANFGATVLVALMVVLVDVDILGLLWWWDLSIDSVAVINLVLAIGLALDYAVHIAHAFMQTPGSRQERVDKALEEMGTPVLHGAFSTFLAVLVLSVSKSYIFRVFFKMFFGICVFGVLHGLVLLPVLLSLIGPAYVDHGAKVHPNTSSKPSGIAISSTAQGGTVEATPSSQDVTSAPPSPPGSEQGGDSPRTWAQARPSSAPLPHAEPFGTTSQNKVAPYIV
eukprot:CAMPEP_0174694160 /NCGR_PEP_ID=MMETSP1094-20130205/789_1 /TAXON_ID=156173 /ORGANISM="Chrysochromulina brevifilum, Strain UTEX LB 985" /LENGTH=1057 /DNA_ID=CAMNT_0015890313 /DNA_START=102 /DNA_END=3275 /DNA_ORIENTATION=+